MRSRGRWRGLGVLWTNRPTGCTPIMSGGFSMLLSAGLVSSNSQKTGMLGARSYGLPRRSSCWELEGGRGSSLFSLVLACPASSRSGSWSPGTCELIGLFVSNRGRTSRLTGTLSQHSLRRHGGRGGFSMPGRLAIRGGIWSLHRGKSLFWRCVTSFLFLGLRGGSLLKEWTGGPNFSNDMLTRQRPPPHNGPLQHGPEGF